MTFLSLTKNLVKDFLQFDNEKMLHILPGYTANIYFVEQFDNFIESYKLFVSCTSYSASALIDHQMHLMCQKMKNGIILICSC